MPDAKRPLPESLLALFAGRDRAAAIYGDLTEMATNRGRLWFVAAYLRTLAALSWRIVAAVVAGMSLRQLLFNTIFHTYLRQMAPEWGTPAAPHLLILLLPWLWSILSFLWFVLPFVAVLYGLHDRFVCLTTIVTFAITAAFLLLPWVSFTGVLATLTLATSTVLLTGWRKQTAVLAITVAFAVVCGTVAVSLSMFLRSHGYVSAYGHGITGLEPMLAFRGSMLASAYLCVRLHRWLLKTSSTSPLA